MGQSFGPFLTGVGASFAEVGWREFFGNLVSPGVVKGGLVNGAAPGGDGFGFQVTAPGGIMSVNIAIGVAWDYGFYFENDAILAQTISAAPTSPNNRIDLIVIQLLFSSRTVGIAVKVGTPATSPTAPTPTQNATTWEIPLAQIFVPGNATQIVSGNITDQRQYAGTSIAPKAQGSGSGLNADLLDGLNSSSFVLKAGDTMTGPLKVNAAATGTGPGTEIGFSGVTAQFYTPQTGAASWHAFVTWNGSASKTPWGVGSAANGTALAYADDTGQIQASNGFSAFAVSSFRPSASSWDALNLISSHDSTYINPLGAADPTFFLGAGFYVYDVKNNGPVMYNGTKNGLVINGALTVNAQGGNTITTTAVGAGYSQLYFHSKDNATPEFGWTMDSRPASPLAMQVTRQGVNGFTFLDIFHIDLNGNISNAVGAGIPMTRNGASVSAPIYTGSGTPSSPPTGSLWGNV